MSQFEQSLAKFLSGKATSDELRISLESMATLEGEDMEFVITTLSNLSAAGRIDPKVHRDLLNTAISVSRQSNMPGQGTSDPDIANDPGDDKTVFRPRPRVEEQNPVAEDNLRASDTPGAESSRGDEPPLSEPCESSPPVDGYPDADSIGTALSSESQPGYHVDSNPKSSRASAWPAAGFSQTPSAALEVGAVIKNRFVLEQLVASGGMGIVFKARDLIKEEAQERNPYVALKVLNERFKQHPESYLALSREARKTQALAHPNIVNVYDFDRDNDTVFMTMELIEGQALDVALKDKALKGQGFPTRQALDYIRQMSEALKYAHQKGVLHCDLKPNNVYLASDGVIKILDFGIAQANRSPTEEAVEQTRFDAKVLGAMTVGYASREVHEGLDPEPSDDIYALACVSYQLLTGRHPYNNKAANTLIEGPEKLSMPAGLDRKQWKALQKALAIKRDDRTKSVADFMAGLDPVRYQLLNGKLAAAAIAALALTGLVFYIPSAIEESKLGALEVEFLSEDPGRINAAIDALADLDEEASLTLLGRVESDLKSYFDDTAGSITDPAQAEIFLPYLERVLGLYSDSQTLSNSAEHLAGLKDLEISNLVASFNYALENNLLVEGSGPGNVEALLTDIEQADPQSPVLRDRRLLLAIQQQAQLAVENGDFNSASSLLNFGLQRFPNNAGLVDTLEIVDSQASNSAEARVSDQTVVGISELDEEFLRLAELIENPQLTPAWDNAVGRVLNTLLANRVMSAAEFEATSEEIAMLYADKVNLTIAEMRFNEASRLIVAGRSYAPDFNWSVQEQSLADARAEAMRAAEIDGLKYTFEAQVSAMQLSEARGSLEKLEDLQIEPADPFLTGAYVDLVERSATLGNMQDALNFVNDGLAYLPDSGELLVLRDELRLRLAQQEIRAYFVDQAGSEESVSQLIAEARQVDPAGYANFIEQLSVDISETLARLERSEAGAWLTSVKRLLPELGDSLDRFIEPDSNQRIENLISSARTGLDEGRINDGIVNYQLAMELDPSHVGVRELLIVLSDALMNEAYELYDDARYAEAVELIDSGIEIEPPNIRTLQQIRQDSQSKLEAPKNSRRFRVPGTF